MRSLAATALTLAFVVMALVTYLAVRGDPMGGEPRLLVKIAPPDFAKLQSQSQSVPAAPPRAAPVAAATTSPGTGAAATASDEVAASTPTGQSTDLTAPRMKPAAAPPADAADQSSSPGVAIPVPQ